MTRQPESLDLYRETEGGCLQGERPCQQVICRYHLACGLSELRRARADLSEPCSLRVASRGPLTLERLGAVMGVTRERARQLETTALDRFARAARQSGSDLTADDWRELLAAVVDSP